MVEVLCYKPEGRRFISQWGHWIFFLIYLILPAALRPQYNQTFNKEISQEFLCSGMPPSLVWTLHALSNAAYPFKGGFPHLSASHMKYYRTVNYNPACLYLSLEAAESHSDMWLLVMKLLDSIVNIWGPRIIIQEIPLNTDFSSISWPTQGMVYPQRRSGQTLIFEIVKVSNDDILFSGLLSFWSLFII
jgi:hypothetical protein